MSTCSTSKQRITRRGLLKLGVVGAAPRFIPSQVFGDEQAPPANERIPIGVIGAGIRGRHLIDDMPAGGRVVALCDCYEVRIDKVRELHPTA